jgi:hypothetical protein
MMWKNNPMVSYSSQQRESVHNHQAYSMNLGQGSLGLAKLGLLCLAVFPTLLGRSSMASYRFGKTEWKGSIMVRVTLGKNYYREFMEKHCFLISELLKISGRLNKEQCSQPCKS